VTIQDLGSLGELIGAVATLATLIYLALQIRANTRVARAEASRASRGTPAHLVLAQDGELTRIYLTGLGDPAKLDAEEWARFSFLLGELLAGTASYYDDMSAGVLTEDLPTDLEFTVRLFLGPPGGRKFWEQSQRLYSAGFRRYADRVLAERPPR